MIVKKVKSLTENMPDRSETALKVFETMINKVEANFEFKTVTY